MSVKDKITPGPWNTYADSPADSVYCDDELGNRVANCENYMLPVEQRKANAKAISKVPEMLDILERLNKWRGYDFAEVTPPESIQDIAHDAQRLPNSVKAASGPLMQKKI